MRLELKDSIVTACWKAEDFWKGNQTLRALVKLASAAPPSFVLGWIASKGDHWWVIPLVLWMIVWIVVSFILFLVEVMD